MNRYQGAWHKEKRLMLPGVIFCDSPESQRTEWIPVKPEEEKFLEGLFEYGHHVNFSRGFIHNGKIHVTEGPLMGLESCIRHVDRHKRLAKLEIPKTGGKQILVGLEIYSKD